MARRFAGQVAWITGAGSGIGKALALELGREGAAVAVSGRRAKNLEEVAREVESAGGKALPVVCDVTDEDDVERAADAVARELGGMHVAIANAGFSVAGKVESLTAEDWRRQLDTNVVGAAITCRHALPHLKKTRGRIALVGSVAAFTPGPKLAPYCASKAAVRMVGLSLAVELHGTGVSVSVIHPGYVESEIAQVDNEGHHDPSRPDRRPKNLMWPADRAARAMLDALHKRKREHVFTAHGKVGAFVGQHATWLVHEALTRGGGKKRIEAQMRG